MGRCWPLAGLRGRPSPFLKTRQQQAGHTARLPGARSPGSLGDPPTAISIPCVVIPENR